MAGVDRRARGKLLDEYLDVMRKAWTGQPFEWRGRQVVVRPRPATEPHPLVLVGGSTEAAARRAARLGLPFMPAIHDPALADSYRSACQEVGFEGGWVLMPSGAAFVHVSEDPDRDWERLAPYALYDAQTYHSWQTPGQRSQADIDADTLEDLKRGDVYRVVTPDECVGLAERGDTLVFHPLMGGMPPELGWESLELFEAKVRPRLQSPAT
jgi:alkanesulfonate monooxygenase SsuD/methylene tetrahydromethanopterin reductase-like flavin-dependent oxidoreductase (luciferase family)